MNYLQDISLWAERYRQLQIAGREERLRQAEIAYTAGRERTMAQLAGAWGITRSQLLELIRSEYTRNPAGISWLFEMYSLDPFDPFYKLP